MRAELALYAERMIANRLALFDGRLRLRSTLVPSFQDIGNDSPMSNG
jgi:hypothetical protein